jgi:circadian clock protein KaiC
VLTGSARIAQEARESAEAQRRSQEIARKQRELDRKRRAMEAEIATLRANLEAEEEELERAITEATAREEQLRKDRSAMATSRRVGPGGNSTGEK